MPAIAEFRRYLHGRYDATRHTDAELEALLRRLTPPRILEESGQFFSEKGVGRLGPFKTRKEAEKGEHAPAAYVEQISSVVKPPAQEEIADSLAKHYADLWNLLGKCGIDVPIEEAQAVDDELAGGQHRLNWKAGKWHVEPVKYAKTGLIGDIGTSGNEPALPKRYAAETGTIGTSGESKPKEPAAKPTGSAPTPEEPKLTAEPLAALPLSRPTRPTQNTQPTRPTGPTQPDLVSLPSSGRDTSVPRGWDSTEAGLTTPEEMRRLNESAPPPSAPRRDTEPEVLADVEPMTPDEWLPVVSEVHGASSGGHGTDEGPIARQERQLAGGPLTAQPIGPGTDLQMALRQMISATPQNSDLRDQVNMLTRNGVLRESFDNLANGGEYPIAFRALAEGDVEGAYGVVEGIRDPGARALLRGMIWEQLRRTEPLWAVPEQLAEMSKATKEKLSKAGVRKPENLRIESELAPQEIARNKMSEFMPLDSPQDIAAVFGTPDGSNVLIKTNGDNGIGFEAYGKEIAAMDRSVDINKNGELVAHNDLFALNKEYRKHGLGLKIFSSQVRAMQALGVKRIETYAAIGNDFNGAITWAKFGYDGELGSRVRSQIEAAVASNELPPEARNAKTIQQLLATEGGETWWETNASGFKGTFDLDPNSVSMKRLRTYQHRKRQEKLREGQEKLREEMEKFKRETKST